MTKTLLEVTGNKITPKQLVEIVDEAREAYETLAKERENTNYNNCIDYHRLIN
jgi:hypothetical protein